MHKNYERLMIMLGVYNVLDKFMQNNVHQNTLSIKLDHVLHISLSMKLQLFTQTLVNGFSTKGVEKVNK